MSIRDFYGGAIKCPVPETFKDVSNLRPVPDYQEVWFSSVKNESFICELLALDDDKALVPNVLSRFADLAETNHVRQCDQHVFLTRVLPPAESKHPTLPADASYTILVGAQRAAKFNEAQKFGDAALKHVDIVMVNLRIPSVQTDMLITWNIPHELMHANPAKLTHKVLVPSEASKAEADGVEDGAHGAAARPKIGSESDEAAGAGGGHGGFAAQSATDEVGDSGALDGGVVTTDEDTEDEEEEAVQPSYCQTLVENGAQQRICPHTQRRADALVKLLPLIHIADWGLFA